MSLIIDFTIMYLWGIGTGLALAGWLHKRNQ